MSTKRAIIIPWRTDNAERERNLQFVLDWYRPLALPLALADADRDAPFNRAASRNDAAKVAGDWEVALFADADCIADLGVVAKAFNLADETGSAVLPHDDFYSLSERGTKELLQNGIEELTVKLGLKYTGQTKIANSWMPSGALIVPRAAYDAIGGYEEGYKGWGWEDTSFLFDLNREVGVLRLAGPLFHLWHPRNGLGITNRAHNKAVAEGHPISHPEAGVIGY